MTGLYTGFDREGAPEPSKRGETIAAISMVGATVIIVSTIVGWRWAGSDRADFAQWLMAGTAVATLFAAVAAAVFAAGAYQLEVRREDRHVTEQRRAHAERFSGWCGTGSYSAKTAKGDTLFDVPVDAVFLRNVSDLPMSNVYAVVRTAEGESLGTIDVGLVPPSDEPLQTHFTLELAEKADAARRAAEDEETIDQAGIVIRPAFRLLVELWFTDAAGHSWRRRADGLLYEID